MIDRKAFESIVTNFKDPKNSNLNQNSTQVHRYVGQKTLKLGSRLNELQQNPKDIFLRL
jgi:hypothetical protein